MLQFSVEKFAQQEFYHALRCALSVPHGASAVHSSVAAAPDSECELVPNIYAYTYQKCNE